MSTAPNLVPNVVYEATSDQVVIAFRTGGEATILEIEAEAVPALVNALMEARRQAKVYHRLRAAAAASQPPPSDPPASLTDRVRARLLEGGGAQTCK